MIKKTIISFALLSMFSCLTTDLDEYNHKSEEVNKKIFNIIIEADPSLKDVRENIQLYCFRYSLENNFDERIFTGRCSSFMRDFGYSSILINDFDEDEIFSQYSNDFSQMTLIHVNIIDENNSYSSIVITIYGIEKKESKEDWGASFRPIWIGKAFGKSINIENKNNREEVAHYLIECFYNSITYSEAFNYEIKNIQY